jgi:hypothetical protein
LRSLTEGWTGWRRPEPRPAQLQVVTLPRVGDEAQWVVARAVRAHLLELPTEFVVDVTVPTGHETASVT